MRNQLFRKISNVLAILDPKNESIYIANAKKVIIRLENLKAEIAQQIRHIQGIPYMMVHDFSQYFDKYFGTNGVGTVLGASHSPPSPKFLRKIQENIVNGKVKCLILEPQFKVSLIQMLINDTKIPAQQVDYLGGNLEKGSDCYFETMRQLAQGLSKGLSAF